MVASICQIKISPTGLFCRGEPPVNFLEPAEKIARFLYEQGSQYCYAIPEIPQAAVKAAEKDIDYIL